MSTMRAARLFEAGKPLQIEQIPIPEPASGEVLLRVEACGLCGTDLHLAIEGSLPVARTPITLGHEAAGTIAALGPNTSGFEVGDRVAAFPAAACGCCTWCTCGRESLCDRSQVFGMARDGALAEYVAVPARSLLALPPEVPFEVGAVITDGVATPFHALRRRALLRAGETVAVIGCGGLGTHAIQLARLMGAACVVAIDTDEVALERARSLGADYVLDPSSEDVARVVRKQLGGVDVALELVGKAATVSTAIRCLGKCGRAVVVGVGSERAELPPLASFVGREQAVLGSFGMDRADIEDLYTLVQAGRLDLSASVSARYPLAQANEALAHLNLKTGGVVRIVVQPQLQAAAAG